jgi:hypothetical protein
LTSDPFARIAPVVADLRRHVLEPIELGIERVDLRELQLAAVAHRERSVELAALEHRLEDAERGWPRRDRNLGSGLGKRLGDREPESAIVGYARDQRVLPGEIDLQHGRRIARNPCGINLTRLPSARISGRRVAASESAHLRVGVTRAIA